MGALWRRIGLSMRLYYHDYSRVFASVGPAQGDGVNGMDRAGIGTVGCGQCVLVRPAWRFNALRDRAMRGRLAGGSCNSGRVSSDTGLGGGRTHIVWCIRGGRDSCF